MSNLVILHFAPLELYPPIQNLVRQIGKQHGDFSCEVISTKSSTDEFYFYFSSPEVRLIRAGKISRRRGGFFRACNYFFYYFISLFVLLRSRPSRVMYFETLSSLPVYIYKRFLNRKCQVFIHYHEYTSVEEYRRGMRLSRYFHRLEAWLYPRVDWVSHTNSLRMERFGKDILPVKIKHPFILPNYPSRSWKKPPSKRSGAPLKIVYVGAFNKNTMYVSQFANWVLNQEGKVRWEIFTSNYSADTKYFIENLKSPWIMINPGVAYDGLPAILKEFDVGVILYTGHIPNYEMNAPNKLFEYLACGLDVWFPKIMTGSLPYVQETGRPCVRAIDFNDLNNFDWQASNASDKAVNDFSFFYEDALIPLVDKLTNS